MSPLHRALAALVPILAAACLTGCSSGSDDPPAWQQSTAPVSSGGLVWAAEGTVHLGDGSTIDVDTPLDTYVVAGDGVYSLKGEEVWFTAPDTSSVQTEFSALPFSLQASRDGRYLGWIDPTQGRKDEYGTAQHEAVIHDVRTGSTITTTRDDSGDPDTDDLGDFYEETSGGAVRFTPDSSTALTIGATGTVTAWDLPSGDEAVSVPTIKPYGVADHNTTQIWSIKEYTGPGEGASPTFKEHFVSDSGRTVYLDPARADFTLTDWDLVGWADDSTAVGWAQHFGETANPDLPPILMTCTADTGVCTLVTDSKGLEVTLPGTS